MFRLTVTRPGKTINTYMQNDVLGTLLPKYKEADHKRLKVFLESSELGDKLELKNRAGKQTTITKTR